MSGQTLTASCLCGAVKLEIATPLLAFRYCACARCRKATGAAHAANMVVPASQLKWLAGEALTKRYDLPGAKRFAVCFCTQCGTRMPHKIAGTENYLVPAGILDASPDARPDQLIFWGSRAPWFVETTELTKHQEYGPG
jgi:hypothetical protein